MSDVARHKRIVRRSAQSECESGEAARNTGSESDQSVGGSAADILKSLEMGQGLDKAQWVELLETLWGKTEKSLRAETEKSLRAVKEKSLRAVNEKSLRGKTDNSIRGKTEEPLRPRMFERSREIATEVFGNKVYIRGLIEISNYCRNDCLYCGIRRSNREAVRYRLSREEILGCCSQGYELGFRTFVLQGGEDPFFTEEEVAGTVEAIKSRWPDCAITLSLGEHSRNVYRVWKDAGADRYLLRHETADIRHYRSLHPKEMSLEKRKNCLWDLKDLGYQVGTGFMVGSPGQTPETLAEDFLFIWELRPQMVGIGPFVPHHQTPFAKEPSGTMEQTLDCIALLRLMMPKALIPATTALGTIAERGRERGILAGANVVMPNLSPERVRGKYEIYDNKLFTGPESAQGKKTLGLRLEEIGYEIDPGRGDAPE